MTNPAVSAPDPAEIIASYQGGAMDALADAGYVIVPREPDAAMREALDAILAATIQDEHERGIYGLIALKAYRAMVGVKT